MVDLRSPTVENRQRKDERRRRKEEEEITGVKHNKPSTRAHSAEQKMPRMSSNDVTPTCVIFVFSISSRAVVFTDV